MFPIAASSQNSAEIEGFDSLAEPALDMRWSWIHSMDEVWRTFDPFLWELTQNPWVVLQTISREKVERVSKEEPFTDAEIQWFGSKEELPDWAEPKAGHLGYRIHEGQKHALGLLFNAGTGAFCLPSLPAGVQWHLAVDTFCETSHDIVAAGMEDFLKSPQTYLLKPRSSAILLTRRPELDSEESSV
jgi:hypothetical protein